MHIDDGRRDYLEIVPRGMTSRISLSGCSDLLPFLRAIFRDDPLLPQKGAGPRDPVVRLEKRGNTYWRHSHWLNTPVFHEDPLDAVCDLTVDFFHAFVTDNPGTLCLHTAAALIGDGLMLFPGYYGTGKSLFSAHLAAAGVRLFTDDALPLPHTDNHGMAMALLPRLRLPIPKESSHAFLKFISAHTAAGNNQYQYLGLDQELLAPFGSTARIDTITLLHRGKEQRTLLEEIPPGEAMKELILRNFARQNKAVDIVDRIMGIVRQARLYRLTYDSPDKAASLVVERFGR